MVTVARPREPRRRPPPGPAPPCITTRVTTSTSTPVRHTMIASPNTRRCSCAGCWLREPSWFRDPTRSPTVTEGDDMTVIPHTVDHFSPTVVSALLADVPGWDTVEVTTLDAT